MAHRSSEIDFERIANSSLAPIEEEIQPKEVFSGGKNGGDHDVEKNSNNDGDGNENLTTDVTTYEHGEEDAVLPQCKIKRNYSCNLCPFFSQNPRSFLYHSRDVHFDRIKIFECSQCLYASKHSQKLQRHINMIHVAGKNRLKRTPKNFKIERKKEFRPIKPKPMESLMEQMLTNNSEEKVLESPVTEDFMKIETGNGSEADREESVDGDYKCTICNFKSKNEKLLRRHEKLVHLKKRFLRCSKCAYVTHVKARYTKHVKYHSMPMIKCDLCDFRTPYKWNLDRHYKNHCGSGAFQCSKCNFRADIKQSLTVHEMNHHVPPVGQGAIMARKKNKVKANESVFGDSDVIEKNETNILNMKKEISESEENVEDDIKQEDKTDEIILQNIRNVKIPYTNKRESANNNHLQTDFIHPDDIVPRYGQIYVKNLKCKFCSYKAVFSHEIWRHEKRIHGFIRPESKKENAPKRPPPKLIPIQNKTSPNNSVSSPILKIPAVKNKCTVSPPINSPNEKTVNENEFNEMCKKSCLTSSLKDFVSLIGDEEGLKTIPDSSQDELSEWTEATVDTNIKTNLLNNQKQTDLLKKKNASFFDKLKEKLLTGNNEEQSLFCELCGHESKCLSEAVAHQKRHSDSSFQNDFEGQQENEVFLSGAELSSTRCQHCRQRCKTSTDLINHLKSCKAFGAAQEVQSNLEITEFEIKSEGNDSEDAEKFEDEKTMENRVFVWNDLSQGHEEESEKISMNIIENEFKTELRMETPTAFENVTNKATESNDSSSLVMNIDPRLNLIVKKVFKCPHCSFWASTASRFHVHIVGHLNKKPFECSLCLYRSNWRWDITKHIRLKSARDPSHLEAQVNMTDETGRRNYSKYNKYLTMMKVQESSAESSGTGRRSKPNEATQGNVADRDIIPLPAPPRLTRAPTPGTSLQMPQGIPLRPPPPLKAAHQISLPVKSSSTNIRSFKDNVKKTLWKCKKCNFRDSVKSNVLAHVKQHYSKKSDNLPDSKILKSDGDISNPTALNESTSDMTFQDSSYGSKMITKTPSYKCGHCQQVSNWKHVIQRHCRLKHNGDALIQIGWKEEPIVSQMSDSGENSENYEVIEDSIELISCDICPFTTDTEGDLTAHKLNHVDRPGSIFKCSYCPFYVPSKIAVLEHMEIHGANDGCDLSSLKVDNFDPNECNEEFTTQNNGNTGDFTKRYKCLQCPYLSNSRTQFLYHKQFHRPRDASFKCMYCSYNVSRRHLLHQHLRVHHMQKEVSKAKTQNQSESESSLLSMNDINTINMPEIPLVWVLKGGNFQKMFKCRWCPHVNMRKINIQEHEKMHQNNNDSEKNISDNSSLKLRCLECNYTCNNAGVLASHIKVHQGFYGEIRSLVDPTRSEADQIRELQSNLRIMEPEVVIKEEIKNSVREHQEFKKENISNESLSSQPENAYCNSSNINISQEEMDETKKVLKFCNKCPARFFFKKELQIHSKFHAIHLPFICSYCSYTARQRPHLLAHLKVHSDEYQRRTTTLVGTYSVSNSHPQPKVALLAKESDENKGVVWIVLSSVAANTSQVKTKENSKAVPKLSCNLCPAKFFKSVALQYHKTLHGSSNRHKCKYCDYGVKTYGNLMRHQLVHEKHSKTDDLKVTKFSYKFSKSDNNLINDSKDKDQRENCQELEINKKSINTSVESQLETLFKGSPEFIYPTYLKNGKLKEKKYKCHKCPSAFEKRDQYRVHLSLHGSKQKYKCEKCDYSVKYYTNYIQHMKKHENHDKALKAKNSSEKGTYDEETLIFLDSQYTIFQSKILSKMGDKKCYNCLYCPYATNQRHIIESHIRKHYCVSKIKSGLGCHYCDFFTSQEHCMREHKKLHFGNSIKYKAEAYIKCDKMELWCCEENDEYTGQNYNNPNVLVFQDRGEEIKNRFFPPIDDYDDGETIENTFYVNLKTGEFAKENSRESLLLPESSEKINVKTMPEMNRKKIPLVLSLKTDDNKLSKEITLNMDNNENTKTNFKNKKTKSKIKKWRGKNWKCKKCPHAFGKKDQYLRHTALHGSNQKHNCDICDYSVKFYTNYVQHMRMHQMNEPDKIIFVKKNCQNADEKQDAHVPRQISQTENSKETSMENKSESDTKKSIDDVIKYDGNLRDILQESKMADSAINEHEINDNKIRQNNIKS